MLIVRGATLAGLAASARLARLGHGVTLVAAGAEPDELPQAITLPAAWRDLFKKSGGHLHTELNRAGLTLAEAPPAALPLPDGSTLTLPSDRAGQRRTLSERFGDAEALAWQHLLDDLDEVWMAYRRHALEGIAPVCMPSQRRELWLDRTLGDVASRLESPLAGIVLGHAATPEAPGLAALPLAVERMFGRWRLVDADGTPHPSSRLLDLLRLRLAERGVRVVEEHCGPFDLDCIVPGWAPLPVRSAADWLALPPICGPDGVLRASSASPAGPEPWAQLGSAALAVYALHERLTGQDARPTNVDFRLPRLPR